MENDNVRNSLNQFPMENESVGNGLKPFPTGKIEIGTNKTVFRFPDIRKMISIGSGAEKEKF